MKRKLFVIAFAVATSFVLAFAAYGADVLSGTWKVNLAKSKYSPGPAPKSNMQKIAAVDNGIKVTADGENSEGKKTHNEYTAKFDGKDYPEHPMLDGKPNQDGADMVAWKKIDDYTYEATAKQKGKVLTTTRHVISKDGKSRTATATGKNAQGQTVNNVVVWEKQ